MVVKNDVIIDQIGLVSATDGGGDQVYFTYDGLGSVVDVTDDTGAVVDSYAFRAFGDVRAQSGSSDNYWLFTGEQADEGSGLYYLRARYYEPEVGLANEP
ncbi:MAG: hypothetical protein GEU28_06655, partial [Dehalococcoidia bacterium]|nr:hypothetical protein [Dehalococcoidia bacterium]